MLLQQFAPGFIGPPEILLLGLLIALLIAGKYLYNKIKEGKYVFRESKNE